MTRKFSLKKLMNEKKVEDVFRKKVERHLTQDDIRDLIRQQQNALDEKKTDNGPDR